MGENMPRKPSEKRKLIKVENRRLEEERNLEVRRPQLPARKGEILWQRLMESHENRANLVRLKVYLEYLKRVLPKREHHKCDLNNYIAFFKSQLEQYTGPSHAQIMAEVNSRGILNMGIRINEYERQSIADGILDDAKHHAKKPFDEQASENVMAILELFGDKAQEVLFEAAQKYKKELTILGIDLHEYGFEELSIAATFELIEQHHLIAVDILNEALRKCTDKTKLPGVYARLGECYLNLNKDKEAQQALFMALRLDSKMKVLSDKKRIRDMLRESMKYVQMTKKV